LALIKKSIAEDAVGFALDFDLILHLLNDISFFGEMGQMGEVAV
jgi:hypothetical protein